MNIEINWFVVVLRLVDGFLYGTGFVLAVLIWYCIIKALPGKKRTTAREGER